MLLGESFKIYEIYEIRTLAVSDRRVVGSEFPQNCFRSSHGKLRGTLFVIFSSEFFFFDHFSYTISYGYVRIRRVHTHRAESHWKRAPRNRVHTEKILTDYPHGCTHGARLDFWFLHGVWFF